MAKSNFLEALIGLIVLAVAGLFVSYVYANTDLKARGGVEYSAGFTSIDGLSVGSDVRVFGVKVGSVVSQNLDMNNYQAVVRFTIDSDVVLAEDSSVKIASEGLLGGSYLKIIPGGADNNLKPGGAFTETQGAVDLIDLVSRAVFAAGDDDDDSDGF
ncbi:MAG: outer membrane lipid asymmetry maintenance protein MlaD [Pseudomonadota bacterium]